MESIIRVNDDVIDELEAAMINVNYPAESSWQHTFTKGLYTRKMYMGAGYYTSKIHLTEHQFAVLAGEIAVSIDANEAIVYRAGDTGITKPGTRRLLYVPNFCIWMTIHATDIQPKDNNELSILEAVEKIEDIIIDKRENKILNANIKNNKIEL
jgi:uncharacterized cupin superfamily protein